MPDIDGIEMNSGTASDYFRRGIEAAQLGFPDKAAAEFEEAAHIEPDNAEIQFNLGTAYLTMGEFEQAIVNLSRAVELKPDMSDGWGNLAVAHAAIGEDQRSQRAAAEAIERGAFPDGLEAVIVYVKSRRAPTPSPRAAPDR